MCKPTKILCTYNNNKFWFIAKLRQLRQAKEEKWGLNPVPGQTHAGKGDQGSKEELHSKAEKLFFNKLRALITIPTVSAVETFRFLGSTVLQDLKWASNIDTIIKKFQQSMYFPQSSSLFSVHPSLSGLKQPPKRTGKEWIVRTAAKKYLCQPALHSGLVHLQSQTTSRKHHCRPITP